MPRPEYRPERRVRPVRGDDRRGREILRAGVPGTADALEDRPRGTGERLYRFEGHRGDRSGGADYNDLPSTTTAADGPLEHDHGAEHDRLDNHDGSDDHHADNDHSSDND